MSTTHPSQYDLERHRYEYIAHQINREDALVNYRLTWTLQANGFLFAALALVGKDLSGPVRSVFDIALPVTGLAVSTAGLLGVAAANKQMAYLTALWRKRPNFDWPRPFGGKWAFGLGTLPAYIPLAVFAGVWLTVLVYPRVQTSSPSAASHPPAISPAPAASKEVASPAKAASTSAPSR